MDNSQMLVFLAFFFVMGGLAIFYFVKYSGTGSVNAALNARYTEPPARLEIRYSWTVFPTIIGVSFIVTLIVFGLIHAKGFAGIACLWLAISAVGCIYFYLQFYRLPALILTTDTIWTKSLGEIKWKDIRGVKLVSGWFSAQTSGATKVKDIRIETMAGAADEFDTSALNAESYILFQLLQNYLEKSRQSTGQSAASAVTDSKLSN